MKFRAFEQIKIIKYQWAGITVCFTILKFTWKLGARRNKGGTLKIIYYGCGIELSFCFGRKLAVGGKRTQWGTADNCWHNKKLWLCSGKAWVRTREVWDVALSFADLGTITDLCCPDATEILKEGRERAGNRMVFPYGVCPRQMP